MSYTDYKIVIGANAEDLSTQMAEAIADGYQPLGQPLLQWGSFNLAQAVVKGTADGGGAGGSYTLPAATAAALGGVKLAAHQAPSTATDAAGLVTDFNALLTKLQGSGAMAGS
jgi:hypothetical protein